MHRFAENDHVTIDLTDKTLHTTNIGPTIDQLNVAN